MIGTGKSRTMDDAELRSRALEVLERNRRGGYTLPAPGLYPFQWCWDTGPIALGWAAAGHWDQAWSEIQQLFSAQWPSGMVPHIVFWKDSDAYFPGPEVWATNRQPPSTGLTQPPLPVSAAAHLFAHDPDRRRAEQKFQALWPKLVAWLTWIGRSRRGPHGAAVVVHPWESGMDNSPCWDEPLSIVPEARAIKVVRRDTATVSAKNRPSQREYRQYIGIVEALRDTDWDTERQPLDSPFAVEDPCFTAIAARAAADLAAARSAAGLDATVVEELAVQFRAGLDALWDEELGWFRPYDIRAHRPVGPATSIGLMALCGGVEQSKVRRIAERLEDWRRVEPFAIPTTDPDDSAFDPARYWRGPIWVIVNWLAAEGLARGGRRDQAEALRVETRALVEQGFSEYFDPRSAEGMGGQGFSWSAALTLSWLTVPPAVHEPT
jgi:hypothetical protein